jgi:mono/diheme cytochrome c family protein
MARLAMYLLFALGLRAADAPSFDSTVLPILRTNCAQCHGDKVRMKDLNLSSYAALLKGSESGPVVVAGKPEESRLYELVHSGKMPLGKAHLAEKDVAIIREWIAGGAPGPASATKLDAPKLNQHDIIPIMLLRCTTCHGLRRKEAGLDLRTRASMLRGGKSGPAIVPGHSADSLLVKRIAAGEMPPKKGLLDAGVKPVTGGEQAKIERWIDEGAPEVEVKPDVATTEPDPLVSDKDRQFWAFQPPRQAAPPKVQHATRVRNPIDAFLLKRLEEKGMSFSPEADRLTLIRRASFDLTGLPPDPAEVRAFFADKDPRAYENLIDRLLASPRYGEHWGRVWLDLAGYADSTGGKLSADTVRPFAWRYRDYVIRAFNSDKPYSRFLLEQIAGDELANYENVPVMTQEIMDNLIATGFLTMGPDSTNEREVNFVDDRLDVIADEVDVLGSSVMGLTIKCARCHSHKYDPIPQRDYYRLLAVFKGAFDEHDWVPPLAAEKYGRSFTGRYLPYVTPLATPFQLMQEQQERELRSTENKLRAASLQESLKQKAEEAAKRVVEKRLAELPKELRDELRKLLDTPDEKRTAEQKELAKKYEDKLEVSPRQLRKLDAAYGKEAAEVDRQVKALEAEVVEPKVQALWDRGEPSPTYILRRGSPTNFGSLVGPGVPSVLTDGKTPFHAEPPWPGAHKTGRRLAFAQWLTRPDHPLTARVLVNRLWKEHFGAGIVKTVANFGRAGALPTNPELLDWLAVEFVRQGWSIKSMQRLILTSSAYRQSSKVTPAEEEKDPDNALLSRMNMRRMSAEVLHDTILWSAGRLDEKRFGPPAPVDVRPDGLVTPMAGPNGWRRSIYVQHRRSNIPTILDSFDFPAMTPNCVDRIDSTVATQALYLLNNGMIDDLADSLTKRIAKEAGPDPREQVEQLYWVALSRPPDAEERKASLEALAKLPLNRLCHTVLNSAAFVYID